MMKTSYCRPHADSIYPDNSHSEREQGGAGHSLDLFPYLPQNHPPLTCLSFLHLRKHDNVTFHLLSPILQFIFFCFKHKKICVSSMFSKVQAPYNTSKLVSLI